MVEINPGISDREAIDKLAEIVEKSLLVQVELNRQIKGLTEYLRATQKSDQAVGELMMILGDRVSRLENAVREPMDLQDILDGKRPAVGLTAEHEVRLHKIMADIAVATEVLEKTRGVLGLDQT